MTDKELDTLVAEKVMGWELQKYERYYSTGGEWRLWTPSTEIESAWQVVEKFARGPWHVFICDTHSDNWKSCLIRSSFASPYPPEKIFYGLMPYKRDDKNLGLKEFKAQAESVPKAICFAALKSVGVEVGN